MDGAVVEDAVIMEDVVIGKSSTVKYSIIDTNVILGEGCSVGKAKDEASGITVIAAGLTLTDGTVIADNKMISTQEDIEVKEEA